jgi:NRAMP (natural resistance-associated macrophage protein)-like metal ion transporter
MVRYMSTSNTLEWGEGRREGYIYYHYDSCNDGNKVNETVEQKPSEKRLLNQTIRVEYEADQRWFSFRKLWSYSGPGLLMSIAYLDPGNLESDLQAGVTARYELIWVIWWSTIVGWLIQCLCIRMGTVTGRHLAEICRCEFGKKTSMLLWIFTELAIVGSDIQEVIGSAIAFKIIFGWRIWIGCLVTAVDTFTFMLTSRYGTRKLELVFTILIAIMVGTFSVLVGIIHPDVSSILEGWAIPRCQVKNEQFAVAILGSMIMSHNLFLHTALVQSRDIDRTKKGAIEEANFYFTLESALSLLLAFYINTTITTAFAKGSSLFLLPEDVGLESAGTYLSEKFGLATELIWGVGLLAAGQSSTMTGTYAGQYVMHGFLDIQWTP